MICFRLADLDPLYLTLTSLFFSFRPGWKTVCDTFYKALFFNIYSFVSLCFHVTLIHYVSCFTLAFVSDKTWSCRDPRFLKKKMDEWNPHIILKTPLISPVLNYMLTKCIRFIQNNMVVHMESFGDVVPRSPKLRRPHFRKYHLNF